MATRAESRITRNSLIQQQQLLEARKQLSELVPGEYLKVGLNAAQVSERVRLKLTNSQSFESSRKFVEILRTNLLTLFNGIVGGCFLLLLVIGQWKDAIFGLTVIANVLIGVAQEYRSKRALDKLALLNAPMARVVRSGDIREVEIADVVVDDLLELGPGDQVVADAEVLESTALQVDESLLTGEVEPVAKASGELILAGSGILAGKARARVVKIGSETYASRISLEAKRFSMVKSELRHALNRVILWISIGLLPIVAIVVSGQVSALGGWAALTNRERTIAVLVSSTASIVSMVPQGLVLITSVAFALAAIRLSRSNVLVQELPAVENLARVDVICFDKTGTLTKGEMTFDKVVVLNDSDQSAIPWPNVLAHFGSDSHANATARCLGPHFQVATPLKVGKSVGFSSSQKWSGYAFEAEGGSSEVWILGAPELVIERERDSKAWLLSKAAMDMGQRVLVLASSSRPEISDDKLPEDLIPRVLVMIAEEVREDSIETLKYFEKEGVSIRILSGDSPQTVAAVARKAGFEKFGNLSGAEAIDARTLPTEISELAKVMVNNFVFGRVGPEQKRDMVVALQSIGKVVAMTGDGVNDALALKKADLGIAMGTGSPATKAVARLVLLDGKFSSLPGVVAEGRKVIANIERISRLFLTKTTWAILLAVVFGLLGWRFPYLPRQLSALDGFTIGLPAIALALLPNSQRYLPGFLKRTLSFAVPAGLMVALAVVATSLALRYREALDPVSLTSAQTSVSLVLAITGLWVLTTINRPLDKWRLLIITVCYLVFTLVYCVPWVADFFGFTWLGLEELIWPLAIALVACAGIEVLTRLVARTKGFDPKK